MGLRDQIKAAKIAGMKFRLESRGVAVELEDADGCRYCFDAVVSGVDENGELVPGGFSFQHNAEARWTKDGVEPAIGNFFHVVDGGNRVYKVEEVMRHVNDVEWRVALVAANM